MECSGRSVRSVFRPGGWLLPFGATLRCRTYALSHFLPSPQENCRDMFKLYYNPGSCSLASHAALGEAGLPYEAALSDRTLIALFSDDYRKTNPLARVSTEEGRVGEESVSHGGARWTLHI